MLMVNMDWIHRNRYGVPILGHKQLDDLGEAIIADFCPEALMVPQEINIDLLSEQYLGLTVDYQYLSHCGVYLGMMVFKDTKSIPAYCPETGRAEYVSAAANTVIIDRTLLDENQEHRYRFTMAHEAAGHAFLHRSYYTSPLCSMTQLAGDDSWVLCRRELNDAVRGSTKNWGPIDWMEWQANSMAAAVLMPKRCVVKVIRKCWNSLKQLNIPPTAYSWVEADRVHEVFNVSFQAAVVRLKKLGFIPPDENVDPHDWEWITEPVQQEA